MRNLERHQTAFSANGFSVINGVFSDAEIDAILGEIDAIDTSKPTFRKSADLFAIRQFLNEIPDVKPLVFSEKLRKIINEIFGTGYFVTKSIYFDKPGESNWFVAYHQDLTISVDRKMELDGFGPWTVKQSQFAVQPPLDFLENSFTIRIHLDKTDGKNGGLKVIPGSHAKQIYRPQVIDWTNETEITCDVEKGGIMLMRPLLLHASGRTTNQSKRRVIHIEFANRQLPEGLAWAEYFDYLA